MLGAGPYSSYEFKTFLYSYSPRYLKEGAFIND